MGGSRGRKITLADRQRVIALIDEACTNGARQQKACEVVGISARSLQRWRRYPAGEDGRNQAAQNRRPANKLTDAERQEIIAVCNQPEYEYKTPHQIVPALADKGIYIASESSFYRVLRGAGQLAHRGKAKAPAHHKPEPVVATAPNQVWSWDITYLRSTISGVFFYLYMIVDIYSRKIVGWDVFETEDSEHASSLFYKAYLREGITGDELVLHSDNGSPMKGATMLVTLRKLGVAPSFSRPGVSNDNPYSEALFKTLKYQPAYPQRPFGSVEEARQWVADFAEWYNEIHRHSEIKFVTPCQRHRGEDVEILEQRQCLYERMKKTSPGRWAGAVLNWQPVEEVNLNPGKPKQDRISLKAA